MLINEKRKNNKLKEKTTLHALGISNSYAIIFFSNSKILAILLMLASFMDPVTGLCGLMAALFSNLFADFAGFSVSKIKTGLYGFNSLLVGLGIGSYFEFSFSLIAIIAVASLLSLLISVSLDAYLGKYNLPFLSIPFLLAMWVLIIATNQYFALHFTERHIFRMNEIYALGGQKLLNIYLYIESLPIPGKLNLFFRSLASLLFQHDLLAGILIAAGLLWYSRIAFSLALLGFFSGIYFYQFIGGDISLLNYAVVGFNFTLTSIAIGGFFFIPSYRSYIWVMLSVPLLAVLASAGTYILSVFSLPLYTLPFTSVVIILLFALQYRESFKRGPDATGLQLFSPEKNLYEHCGNKMRFGSISFSVSLPFIGRWYVSQGFDGTHTHQGEWRHAWDFEIRKDDDKNFENTGTVLNDYLCYGKPVLAPGDGVVTEINGGIEDNAPGDVNTAQNWGNTIIIKHSPYLFSKLSHLKNGSIKVKTGDFVKRGDIIASVGNSGRSPYPHLHFQLQASPYIGSKTIEFPLSNFFTISNDKSIFNMQGFPQEKDVVESIRINQLLKKTFHLIPGKIFQIEHHYRNTTQVLEWEVFTNYFNQSYIYCRESKSSAFFSTDNGVFYFLSFYGNKRSMLYHFSLALNKVLLGQHPEVEIIDVIPLNRARTNVFMPVHDVIAPFYRFFKLRYSMQFGKTDHHVLSDEITIESKTSFCFLGKSINATNYQLKINENGFEALSFSIRKKTHLLKWISE